MEKEKVNIDVIDDDGRQADNLSTILQRWGYDAALIDTFKSKYLPTLDHLFMVSFYPDKSDKIFHSNSGML